jgi:Peptidase_C39 like family
MPAIPSHGFSASRGSVRAVLLACLLAWVLAIQSGCRSSEERASHRLTVSPAVQGSHFIGLTNFSGFDRGALQDEAGLIRVSPVFLPPAPWMELIVSWNAVAPPGCGLKIEARAIYPDRATSYYTMGLWAEDTTDLPRTSINGQKDEDGDVLTDTLVLSRPAQKCQVRLSWRGTNAAAGRLKFLGLSFASRAPGASSQTPNRRAWGRVIPVPELSQLSYEGGENWCSPTTVSMVLAYWSHVLGRAELKLDVPEVAAGVFDPNWPGTGNWPFNTAFAGKFPGLRAYVTRVRGIPDLESWVNSGVTPILSVSSDVLNGRSRDRGSGHLVVCVGFTDTGEVVLNDPGVSLTKGQSVRRIISRDLLVKAWAHSCQTVYLIYPEGHAVPTDL